MTCPNLSIALLLITQTALTEENDALAAKLQDARNELITTDALRKQFAAVAAENLELRKRVTRLEREAERVKREAGERERERRRFAATRVG